jgi:hypothetical protein
VNSGVCFVVKAWVLLNPDRICTFIYPDATDKSREYTSREGDFVLTFISMRTKSIIDVNATIGEDLILVVCSSLADPLLAPSTQGVGVVAVVSCSAHEDGGYIVQNIVPEVKGGLGKGLIGRRYTRLKAALKDLRRGPSVPPNEPFSSCRDNALSGSVVNSVRTENVAWGGWLRVELMSNFLEYLVRPGTEPTDTRCSEPVCRAHSGDMLRLE